MTPVEMLMMIVGGLLFAAAGFMAARMVFGGRAELLLSQQRQLENRNQELQQQIDQLSGLEAEQIRFEEQLKSAAQQQQQAQAALVAANEKLNQLNQQVSELKQQLGAAGEVGQQLAARQAENQQQQEQLIDLRSELSRSEEARQHEQRNTREQVEQFEKTRAQLKLEFEQLANKIFEDKQKQFTTQNQQGVESLLKPFSDQIKSFRDKVEQVAMEDVKGRATLKTELQQLRELNQQITEDASDLTRALKGDKKLQGNWGETQVQMILERSGLRVDHEYRREENFKDEADQNKRVDFIVDLPDDKHLIIDSKVSLIAYTEFVAAEDENSQDAALIRHVDAVKKHIKDLSGKNYTHLKGVTSPDFVFMFMPIEPAFNLAMMADQNLFNTAYEQNIVITTPSTLMATLRIVANIWANERRNQSAQIIADQAGKVYNKLVGVVEKMEKLGAQLQTVNKTYEGAWNSLKDGRGNLVATTQKFVDLGVRVKKELPQALLESADPADESDLDPTEVGQKKNGAKAGKRRSNKPEPEPELEPAPA
ncbi:MAG: DNA recombination protein RmuC, partial [Immundisolibacteraceae bacterium]|nr:DNA recombination protein RmuC [Immundisolibacteraceae bacterium]